MKMNSIVSRKLAVLLTGLAVVTAIHTASAQVYGPGQYPPNVYGYGQGNGYNQGNRYNQGYPNGYDPRYSNGYNQGYPNQTYGYPQGGYYGNNGYGPRPNVVIIQPPYPVYPVAPPIVIGRPPVIIQALRYWGGRGNGYYGHNRGGGGRRW